MIYLAWLAAAAVASAAGYGTGRRYRSGGERSRGITGLVGVIVGVLAFVAVLTGLLQLLEE